MIACVSSFGTQIYKLDKRSKEWKRVLINECPTRGGLSLQWHLDGKMLASAMDPEGDALGSLSIISFDANFLRFNANKAFECDAGESISSLTWSENGEYLVVSLQPSAQIHFFKVDDIKAPQNLRHLGCKTYPFFPAGSRIVLTCHDSLAYIFASAKEANQIAILTTRLGGKRDWKKYTQCKNCGPGVFGMTFTPVDAGLITLENDNRWRWWNFRGETFKNGKLEMLIEEWVGENEHTLVKPKKFRWGSVLTCIASSKDGKLVASGGTDNTLVVHKKLLMRKGVWTWAISSYKNSDVCYHEPRCMKFYHKNDPGMRLAMGGVSGYIFGQFMVKRRRWI